MAIRKKSATTADSGKTPQQLHEEHEANAAAQTKAAAAKAQPSLPLENDDMDLDIGDIPQFLRRGPLSPAPVIEGSAIEIASDNEEAEEEVKSPIEVDQEQAAEKSAAEPLAEPLPPVDGVAVKGKKIGRKGAAAKVETVVTPAVEDTSDTSAVALAMDAPIMVDDKVIGSTRTFLERVEALIKANTRSNYDLGGALRDLAKYDVLATLGYKGVAGFEEYLDKHFGFSYRTARDLINVRSMLDSYGLDGEVIEKVGWTKCVAMLATPRDKFPALMDYAMKEGVTVKDVQAAADAYKGKTPSAQIARSVDVAQPQQMVSLPLLMPKEDAEFLNAAVEAAIQKHSKDEDHKISKSAAVRAIAAEWAESSGFKLSLEDEIRNIEQRHRVRLQVVERDVG